MSKVCNAGKSYGLTVRVPREIDLRRFPSLPRATKQFERLYEGRTAVERLNTRLKVFWGADDGNVTGSRRFFAHLGVVMVVHAAFAVLLAAAPRWEGTLSQTKLTPIAQALHGRPKPKTGRGGTPPSTSNPETTTSIAAGVLRLTGGLPYLPQCIAAAVSRRHPLRRTLGPEATPPLCRCVVRSARLLRCPATPRSCTATPTPAPTPRLRTSYNATGSCGEEVPARKEPAALGPTGGQQFRLVSSLPSATCSSRWRACSTVLV